MLRLISFIFLVGVALTAALSVSAGAPTPTPCPWGIFEMPLPGIDSPDICKFVEGDTPTITLIQSIVKFITAVIVAVGLISVIVGGFIYMTAGGSAERVGLAKTVIISALLGIVLALTSWLILNTISPKFTSDVKDLKELIPQ